MLSQDEIEGFADKAPGAAEAEPVIVADGVSLTFETNDGPVHALRDVNLQINRGDFVSFIGPSGCGKTTFLRAIAALEHPTEGSLTVNGMTPDAA
ncbi:MAG: NitT/TauT family transport system ATP-binding protein, partial [Dinoroseobacter sp.]